MPAGELSRQVQLLRLLLPDLDASLAASSAAQQRWRDVAAALQELADTVSSSSSSNAAPGMDQLVAELMQLVEDAIG